MATYTISVQRYDLTPGAAPDALTWQHGPAYELPREAAIRHRADLARRRRDRNLTVLPDGLEFDTYATDNLPVGCEDLARSRTRVLFQL